MHGNTDYCTPILHLLFSKIKILSLTSMIFIIKCLDHRMKIDMSAIFDINYNFVTANFSAGAGYPANALKYFSRYIHFSPKNTIQKSFAKATSNKNLE